jgi:hypothetical protein
MDTANCSMRREMLDSLLVIKYYTGAVTAPAKDHQKAFTNVCIKTKRYSGTSHHLLPNSQYHMFPVPPC